MDVGHTSWYQQPVFDKISTRLLEHKNVQWRKALKLFDRLLEEWILVKETRMVGNVRLYFVIAVVNVFCTTLTVLFVTNSLGGRCDDRPGSLRIQFSVRLYHDWYQRQKDQNGFVSVLIWYETLFVSFKSWRQRMILLQALQWFWSNPTQSMDRLFKVEVAGISFQILISSLGISFQRSPGKNSIFSSTCQQHWCGTQPSDRDGLPQVGLHRLGQVIPGDRIPQIVSTPWVT